MAITVGDIELYCGPKSLGAPDDLEQVIVNFILKAQSRLDIAVQELENRKIADAIIEAKNRKVSVRIVIEHDYLMSKTVRPQPYSKGGKHEGNREIFNALLRSKVDIKSDYNSKIFHQKFIVRDGTAVLTGSTNFTPTGTQNNLNHVVVVNDQKAAKIYAREFREIWKGHFGKHNVGHNRTPDKITVSNIPIRILFAPDHNPEMEIMKQMLKAKERVDFAIFTFSKSSGIDDTMIKLLELNIPITGVLDKMQGVRSWAATRPLKNAGANLFSVAKKGRLGKLHHKLMVLDEQAIIVGSFNYTGPANLLNDENIMIIGDLESTSDSVRNAQGKLAEFAQKEIGRIIASHAENVN